jgi:class 3 adenylate cyclase
MNQDWLVLRSEESFGQDLPRGVVTLLFTDIEGSTRLLQRLGDQYGDALTKAKVSKWTVQAVM